MLTLFCSSLCVSLCVQGCDRGTTSARRTAPLSTPTQSSSWTKLWPPKNHTRRYLAAPHPPAPACLHLLCLWLFSSPFSELARTLAPTLTCHECLCRCVCFALLFSICSSNACTHTQGHWCARTHSHPCSSPRLFTHSLCVTLQLRPRHHHPIIGALLFPWQQSRRRLSLPFPFSYILPVSLHSLNIRFAPGRTAAAATPSLRSAADGFTH